MRQQDWCGVAFLHNPSATLDLGENPGLYSLAARWQKGVEEEEEDAQGNQAFKNPRGNKVCNSEGQESELLSC
eukprot:5512999-Amphidinium_carterae.1